MEKSESQPDEAIVKCFIKNCNKEIKIKDAIKFDDGYICKECWILYFTQGLLM
jgi:hypothetical protein